MNNKYLCVHPQDVYLWALGEHRCCGFVGEQLLRPLQRLEQPLVQRAEQEGCTPDPVGQGRAVELNALASKDLRLPIELQVIGVLGDVASRTRTTLEGPIMPRASAPRSPPRSEPRLPPARPARSRLPPRSRSASAACRVNRAPQSLAGQAPVSTESADEPLFHA